VFTGLETVWVTVDKVGIPTLGLDGTGPARPPTLAPAPEGSGIMEETDMVGLPTDTKHQFFHMDTAYRVLPYLLCRLGLVHHGLYPPSLIPLSETLAIEDSPSSCSSSLRKVAS
jgi:hypothetical protein